MDIYCVLPEPLVLCWVCVCVCVCVCLHLIMIIVVPLMFLCKFLLLWYGVASNSLLVFLGRVEPSSIKGSLQTTKYLGAIPLAWWAWEELALEAGTTVNKGLLEGLWKVMIASSSSSKEVLLPLCLLLSVDRHRWSFDTKDKWAKAKTASKGAMFHARSCSTSSC